MPLSLATVTISVTGRHKSTIEAMSQETCQTGTLVGSRGMTTTADRNLYVLFCDGDKNSPSRDFSPANIRHCMGSQNMKQITKIFFLFSILFNFSATANDDSKTGDSTRRVVITPIIQTISDFETPISSTMLNVEVIEPEEIENSTAITFGELIAGRTGIESSFSGGPGSLNSNFLRGQDSVNYVLLIDGVKAQTDYLGNVKPYDIPISQIYKIEVIKGNVSAIYGDAAVGGAINIITKPALSRDTAFGSIKYGSFGTREAVGSISKKLGAMDVTFGYSNLKTDGFNAIRGSQKPGIFFNTDEDGFERTAYYTKLSSKITNKLSINASINNSESALDQDNFYNNFAAPAVTSQADADKYFYTFESTNKDSRLGFDYKYGLNSKFSSTYASSKLKYENFKNGVLDATFGSKESEGSQKALTFQNTTTVQSGSLSNSLAQKLEFVKNDYTDDNGSGERNSKSFMLGAFLTDGKYNFNFSLKPERIKVTSGTSKSKTFQKVPYLMGVGKKFGDVYLLSSTFSTSFRAPDAYAYNTNSNIKSEVHESIEISAKKNLINGHLRATAFSTSTSNAIYYDSSYNYFNIGRLQNKGMELSAKLSDLSVFDADFSLTIQDPKSRPSSAFLIAGENSLKKRAKTFARLQLSTDLEKSSIATTIKYSSSKSDTEGKIQPALSVNGSFSMPLGQSAEILVQAVNIFDSDTQTTHAYNSAGRSVFLTLKGNFSFGY